MLSVVCFILNSPHVTNTLSAVRHHSRVSVVVGALSCVCVMSGLSCFCQQVAFVCLVTRSFYNCQMHAQLSARIIIKCLSINVRTPNFRSIMKTLLILTLLPALSFCFLPPCTDGSTATCTCGDGSPVSFHDNIIQ
jgi:hypothetical protein